MSGAYAANLCNICKHCSKSDSCAINQKVEWLTLPKLCLKKPLIISGHFELTSAMLTLCAHDGVCQELHRDTLPKKQKFQVESLQVPCSKMGRWHTRHRVRYVVKGAVLHIIRSIINCRERRMVYLIHTTCAWRADVCTSRNSRALVREYTWKAFSLQRLDRASGKGEKPAPSHHVCTSL